MYKIKYLFYFLFLFFLSSESEVKYLTNQNTSRHNTTRYVNHDIAKSLMVDKLMSSHSIYRQTAHHIHTRLQQKKQNISLLFCLFILVLYHHSWNCPGLGNGNTRLRLTQYNRKKYLSGLLCRKCHRLFSIEYWSLYSSCQLKIYLNTIHLVKCKTTSKINKNIAYLSTWRRSQMINLHFQPHLWRCSAGMRWLSLLWAVWFPSWERVAVHKHTTAGGMGKD